MKDLTRLSDDELIDLAIRAHRRHAQRHGHLPDQPCVSRSVASQERVILANVRGVLAEYRVGKARLVRLRDK